MKTSTDLDAYFAAVTPQMQAPLQELREVIRSAVPDATEAISYQMPTFVHHGGLVCYAAFTNHLGLFPMSGAVLDQFADELHGYRTGKGTLRFDPAKPLPTALIKKLVKARVAENEAKAAAKKTRPRR
jgi:uncharacterized protein YdhG (YjbR/CyaY superfamily)